MLSALLSIAMKASRSAPPCMDDELRQLCQQASESRDSGQVLDLVNQIIQRMDKKSKSASVEPAPSSDHDVVAIRIESENVRTPGHRNWKRVVCGKCSAKFSVRIPRGVVPRWELVTNIANLRTQLSNDHANEQQHSDRLDLGLVVSISTS